MGKNLCKAAFEQYSKKFTQRGFVNVVQCIKLLGMRLMNLFSTKMPFKWIWKAALKLIAMIGFVTNAS